MPSSAVRAFALVPQTGAQFTWRETRDPYRILLSETMLQQLQVETSDRLLRALPRPSSPRGRSRRRAHRRSASALAGPRLPIAHRAPFQASCREVLENYDGEWPQTAEELMKLPALGPTPRRRWQPLPLAVLRQWWTPISPGFTPAAMAGLAAKYRRAQKSLATRNHRHPVRSHCLQQCPHGFGSEYLHRQKPRLRSLPLNKRCLSNGKSEVIAATEILSKSPAKKPSTASNQSAKVSSIF